MLYPNPASDVATLVINATEDMHGVVTILDMAGNMVMPAAEQHILSGKTTIQLATADLASGMYMVNILAQGTQQTLPLLIAK